MLIHQIELSAGISAVTLKLRLTSIDNFIYLKQTLDSPWVSNFPFSFSLCGLVRPWTYTSDVKKESTSNLM